MKKYYKAELPKEIARKQVLGTSLKGRASITRTTVNGDYNYAHFDGDLCFSNQPSSFEDFNAVVITKEEYTKIKKEEKSLQDKPVTVVLADTQQGVKEITTENNRSNKKLSMWYYKNIRHYNLF
tara:strand:+ start:561 stop:932 length:372 start_codon:yes stop_codon:yes gene_type:complete